MNYHKVGDIVPLDAEIYIVKRMESGWVFLRKPNGRGKEKRMHWREVPYFENGELVVPKKVEESKPSFNSKLHLGSLFKKNSEFQISKEFIAFAYENIESLIFDLLSIAEENALKKGHRRLVPAHWYNLEMPPNTDTSGYWVDNNDYALRESLYNGGKK